MKHQLSELEVTQNPQLEAEAGESVDEKDVIYPIIPNDPTIGSRVETIIARANPSHYENNKINVVEWVTPKHYEVIRTYSGETDGLNWKKYADLYAAKNGYTLAPYTASLAEKAGIEGDRDAQDEQGRLDEEAEAERREARVRRESLGGRVKSATKTIVNKVRGK
jgi:hypothetical protein